MAEKRFLYNGSALALGGSVTRPYCDIIAPQASMVLPISGGHGSVCVDDFRFRDLISFKRAVSTTSGSHADEAGGNRIYNTLVTTTIEGLNIRNVVTADRVVGKLVSEHSGDGEVPLHVVGTHFDNLRIAGEAVEPRAIAALFAGDTVETLHAMCKKHKAPFGLDGKPINFEKIPAKGVLVSLFERPATLPAGCSAEGTWGIKVPGFGTVYLGELFVTRGARSLTMIRIEMGSPEQGDVDAGIVRGNGSTYP